MNVLPNQNCELMKADNFRTSLGLLVLEMRMNRFKCSAIVVFWDFKKPTLARHVRLRCQVVVGSVCQCSDRTSR
jgi:hypothetical protein